MQNTRGSVNKTTRATAERSLHPWPAFFIASISTVLSSAHGSLVVDAVFLDRRAVIQSEVQTATIQEE